MAETWAEISARTGITNPTLLRSIQTQQVAQEAVVVTPTPTPVVAPTVTDPALRVYLYEKAKAAEAPAPTPTPTPTYIPPPGVGVTVFIDTEDPRLAPGYVEPEVVVVDLSKSETTVAAEEIEMRGPTGPAPVDAYGHVATWNYLTGTWRYPIDWGKAPTALEPEKPVVVEEYVAPITKPAVAAAPEEPSFLGKWGLPIAAIVGVALVVLAIVLYIRSRR